MVVYITKTFINPKITKEFLKEYRIYSLLKNDNVFITCLFLFCVSLETFLNRNSRVHKVSNATLKETIPREVL